MNTLKIAVPLVALVAVVFGITFILQYTPTEDPAATNKPGEKGVTTSGKPPLIFFTSARAWDPPELTGEYKLFPLLAPSADPNKRLSADSHRFTFTGQDRIFQGFFEPSQDTPRRTQFWFENPNSAPVIMELKGLSCSACTGGRAVAFPPELTNSLLQHVAVASLPIGPFNPYGVGLVEPAAGISNLEWQEASFENHHSEPVQFKIPAADPGADKWSPRWGILELNFKVGPKDQPKTISADFATQVEGTQQAGGNRFNITFFAATPFELSRPSIDLGRLGPTAGEREYDVVAYSLSRGPGSEFGDLDEPSVAVQTTDGKPAPGKFVEVSKPVRVAEADLIDLELPPELKSRVRAAYKFKVTVRPKAGDERLDIGLLERVVAVTAGGVTHQVRVSGGVAGAVRLDPDGTEINLGSFKGSNKLEHTAKLVTEATGVELEVLRGESAPEKFTYELVKQPDSAGRGYYNLKITIPEGQFGQVRGEIVLQVKGPNPQKMRIPVKGSGTFTN